MARSHEPERRRPDAGPSFKSVTEALENITQGNATDVPGVRDIRALEKAGITPPLSMNGVDINEWVITQGDPRHGAKRSDDHVSKWEVEYWAKSGCPECGSHHRLYRYQAHHHIAGSEVEFCTECEEKIESEEWG